MASTSTELPGRSRTRSRAALIIGWLKSRALAVCIVLAVLYCLAGWGQLMGYWDIPYIIAGIPLIALWLAPGILSWVQFFKERRRRANPGQKWSFVQSVGAARRVRVEVRDETIPWHRRRLTGNLLEASAESLTISLQDGSMRTIPVGVVRKVSVGESVLRSRKGRWLTALTACGALVVILVWQDPRLLILLLLIVLMSELFYKPIYAVPKSNRSLAQELLDGSGATSSRAE